MNGAGLLLALIAGGFTGAIVGAYIARAVTLRVIADARAAYQAAVAADAQYHPPPTTSNGRTPMPNGAPTPEPGNPYLPADELEHGRA